MDLLLHGLLKLIDGFVKAVMCISWPLPHKTKLQLDKILKLIDRLKAMSAWGPVCLSKCIVCVFSN